MKITDLMIGDWVAVYGTPRQIIGLQADGTITTDDNRRLDINVAQVEPIALTTEILKKNGGKLIEVGDNGPATPSKNTNRYEHWQVSTKWSTFELFYDRLHHCYKFHFVGMFVVSNIFNVHQLQHAMLMCGIEQNIEI